MWRWAKMWYLAGNTIPTVSARLPVVLAVSIRFLSLPNSKRLPKSQVASTYKRLSKIYSKRLMPMAFIKMLVSLKVLILTAHLRKNRSKKPKNSVSKKRQNRFQWNLSTRLMISARSLSKKSILRLIKSSIKVLPKTKKVSPMSGLRRLKN